MAPTPVRPPEGGSEGLVAPAVGGTADLALGGDPSSSVQMGTNPSPVVVLLPEIVAATMEAGRPRSFAQAVGNSSTRKIDSTPSLGPFETKMNAKGELVLVLSAEQWDILEAPMKMAAIATFGRWRPAMTDIRRVLVQAGLKGDFRLTILTTCKAFEDLKSFVEQLCTLWKNFLPLLSEAGLDLLNGLLTYDPEKRITAEDALKHAWFREVPLPRQERVVKRPDPLEEQRLKEMPI